MAKHRKIAIVTYSGVDGACAAAMVQLRYPRAKIWVTSARLSAWTLAELLKDGRPPTEVHVCGVGASGDWNELTEAAQKLADKGTKLFWYCGRGYLDEEKFSEVCTPVFLDLWTNTDAVCQHLQLEDAPNAQFLRDLAAHDENIAKPKGKPPEVDSRWLDLIETSRLDYFKWHDRDRYTKTIRKLAKAEMEPEDLRRIEIFNNTGKQYVLNGTSADMRNLRRTIRKVAEIDEPVLIMGETGTGKDVVAHLIHEGSRRATGPMVTINCAAFVGNESLANSRLFGHVRGAFTGAEKERPGAFVTADGGTLFLDELGELPLDVQGKMLRVLEEMTVTPEGSDETISELDVLVIGATNRDLPEMIRQGEFRADLFHRMSALRMTLPPLRDRPEDLDAIAKEILAKLSRRGWPLTLSSRDRDHLHRYEWPGNVRQLHNVLRRAAYMDMKIAEVIEEERQLGSLEPAKASDDARAFLPGTIGEIVPLEEARNAYARHALSLHGGNIHATARALQITDRTLIARLDK
jgi:DNA-binding NtrC family response regulator